MGRAAFRLIDAPYRKAWFVNDRHEVSADWSEVRTRILESDARCTITPLVTSYEMFRDIIFGNNRKPDMVSYRKFAIVESSKYQNIPRTIQHVFLNSRLDADFVKDTIIQSMNEEDVSIDLTYYRSQIEAFEPTRMGRLWCASRRNKSFSATGAYFILKSSWKKVELN